MDERLDQSDLSENKNVRPVNNISFFFYIEHLLQPIFSFGIFESLGFFIDFFFHLYQHSKNLGFIVLV